MGREIKRVQVDFTWPLRQVWSGFLMPERLSGVKCPDCERGYSAHAAYLHQLWYGYAPFNPVEYGSVLLTPDTPVVRRFAVKNVTVNPEYYGTGELAIWDEGRRLARRWNESWSHHINQDDVNALVAAGRLHDLTHTWSRESGWEPLVPAFVPSAEQVNEWSLDGFGHDAINANVVISARCEREGFPVMCATCDGHASVEVYPGQRAEADAWECEEPPAGDGWQLWENVTEGSPVSPVFTTPEALASWMSELPAEDLSYADYSTALAFVNDGYAPSFVVIPSVEMVMTGVQAAWLHNITTSVDNEAAE